MENNAEHFYVKLISSDTPGAVLAAFYCSLYNITSTRSEIIVFNKLVKAFGRKEVFFSILAVAGSYPEIEGNPYPLFYKICTARFERSHEDSTLQSRTSLEPFINKLNEEIEKLKKEKLKIPKGFD